MVQLHNRCILPLSGRARHQVFVVGHRCLLKQKEVIPQDTEILITAITNDSSPTPSSPKQWLSALRRRAGLILVCTLVAAIAAGGLSMLQEKEYTASATLLFNDPDFARRSVFSDPTDAGRVLATYVELDVLKDVSSLTSDAIAKSKVEGAGDLAPEEISTMMSVVAAGDTDLVEIDATAAGAELSALVANTFARQFIVYRAQKDRTKLNAAKRIAERKYDQLPPAEKAGPTGKSLERTATRLGMIAALQNGNAEFIEAATAPSSPTSPKPLKNGVLGGLLGLVLGLGMVVFVEKTGRSNKPS